MSYARKNLLSLTVLEELNSNAGTPEVVVEIFADYEGVVALHDSKQIEDLGSIFYTSYLLALMVVDDL
jgi:hypothetical protein